MFKCKYITQYIVFLLLFTMIACAGTESDNPEKIIQKVYAAPNPFRNEDLDSTLFSERLYQLITAAKETEKASKEQIRKSKSPTDKPILIEGEIFATLYEGYTGWKILGKKQIEDTVWLNVQFTNSNYQQSWQDQLVCIFEKNKWKFDNVLYGKPSHLPNMQEVLRECIVVGQKEKLIY